MVILTHRDGEARIRDALEQGARGYLLLGCSLKELFDEFAIRARWWLGHRSAGSQAASQSG